MLGFRGAHYGRIAAITSCPRGEFQRSPVSTDELFLWLYKCYVTDALHKIPQLLMLLLSSKAVETIDPSFLLRLECSINDKSKVSISEVFSRSRRGTFYQSGWQAKSVTLVDFDSSVADLFLDVTTYSTQNALAHPKFLRGWLDGDCNLKKETLNTAVYCWTVNAKFLKQK